MEEKGKSSESVETFEAFYELIKQEARKLQQEYQPQLRNGIKIAVDLINSVQKDKKDGDVDVKVKIAPNTNDIYIYIPHHNNRDINAQVLHKTEIVDYKGDKKVTVDKAENVGRGKKIIGYKVTSDEKMGFAVGQSGERNNFIKKIDKKKKDSKQEFEEFEEFEQLSKKPTVDERRNYIQQVVQSNEEKIKSYNLVLQAADIDERPETKIQNPSEPTNGEVKKYRKEMRDMVCKKYENNLERLDGEVLHNKNTANVHNKILGGIFEQWLGDNLTGDVSMKEVVFKIDYNNKKYATVKADAIQGNTLIEAKAVTGKPSGEQQKQMRMYNIIINQEEGFSITGKAFNKNIKNIQYHFSNQEAALIWKPLIDEIFKNGECEIYVGTVPLAELP